MNNIALHNALPAVFAGRGKVASDVWECEVTFERGNHYMITAHSGTGKSSLCSYIYGYRIDYSGSITFDGRDIASLTVADWCDVRRQHIAYLPQDLRLFPELTALENVQLKNRLSQFKSEQEIEEMFALLGITDKLHQPVARLSIGQQQRVAIIRTLCQRADFIILDEPVSHLDDENNRIVARMVQEQARAMGAGLIVTSVGNHLTMDVDHELML